MSHPRPCPGSQPTCADIQAYRQQGFFIPGERIPADHLETAGSALAEILTHSQGREDAGGVFAYDLHSQRPDLLGFCQQPLFRRLCADLIGPESYLCWSQMIAKMPGRSGTFAWHQDAYYALRTGETRDSIEAEDLADQVVCWVAITPATRANGALSVAPGWHTRGLLPHEWDEKANAWRCIFAPDRVELAELPEGGLVVFSRLTPHCSGPNTTDSIRLGLQIAFRRIPRASDARRAVRMPPSST